MYLFFKLFYLYTPLNLLCKEMRCLNKIIIITRLYETGPWFVALHPETDHFLKSFAASLCFSSFFLSSSVIFSLSVAFRVWCWSFNTSSFCFFHDSNVCTRHKTRDTWHVTRDTRHATRDTRHATRDTRHATRDTRHATRDTRHATRDTWHMTHDTWHKTRHMTCDTRHAMHDTRHTTRLVKATWSVRVFLFLLQNHVNQYKLWLL